VPEDELEHREWLNLPTCPYERHPLSLSIGHRAHGLQMQTGWPPNFSSARDFDPKLCNIAVDTWSSNRAKMNWDAEADEMKDDFLANIKESCLPFWTKEEFETRAPELPDIMGWVKDGIIRDHQKLLLVDDDEEEDGEEEDD
jgi:hypothetical protein